MSDRKPKLVLIGLDGAAWEEIRPLAEGGDLPSLAGLMNEGATGELRSCIPPVTSSAWTSLFTGVSPGDHGVIDMETYDEERRRWRSVFLADCRRTPFWREFNQAGLSVGLLAVPFTYPPDEINGWSISGIMGTPDYCREMFHPPALYDELTEALGEMPLVPPNVVGGGQDVRILEAQGAWIQGAARHLLQNHPVDVFMVVENYTDHTQHGYMHSRRSKRGAVPDIIARAYRLGDDLVGAVQAEVGHETPLIVLSDHGSGPGAGAINVSRLNVRLPLDAPENTPLEIVLPQAPKSLKSRVKPLLGRLARCVWGIAGGRRLATMLHHSGEEPDRDAATEGRSHLLIRWVGGYGVAYWDPQADLSGLDLERMGARVREALGALRIPGEDRPMFTEVHDGAELYGTGPGHRPFMVATPPPELLALPLGLDAPLAVTSEQLMQIRPLNMSCEGTHRMEGIILANQAAFGKMQSLPREISRVLGQMRAILSLPDPPRDDPSLTDGDGGPAVSESDIKQVERRLSDLGYL